METTLKLVGVFTVLAAIAFQFVLQTIAPQLVAVILWCGGWLIMGMGSIIRRLDERHAIVDTGGQKGERP